MNLQLSITKIKFINWNYDEIIIKGIQTALLNKLKRYIVNKKIIINTNLFFTKNYLLFKIIKTNQSSNQLKLKKIKIQIQIH